MYVTLGRQISLEIMMIILEIMNKLVSDFRTWIIDIVKYDFNCIFVK